MREENKMRELPFRQIHLDFHTSPLIPDVGVDFNADEFVETLVKAHVESINIFAKCHHGMSYYPSKVGPAHPAMKQDILGEMISALHKKNIKCPIYTTVVWDEYAANEHPEWLQIDSHGKIVGREPYGNEYTGWKWLCLNNGYMDYLCAQVQEIMDNYDADGLWFDIVMYSEDGCSCNNCIRDTIKKGLDPTNIEDRRTHTLQVLREAMKRLYNLVKKNKPDALVVFNGRQRIEANPERSLRGELDYCTQIDIESLPSGMWGYNHFPMFIRYNQIFGKEIVGMNGKFHKSWADFGGFKNKAALEYECFSMIANGAKVGVGDQLHPRGRLEKATYDLIGSVFEQIEKKEPWCKFATPVDNIALFIVNDGEYGRANRPLIKNLEAAMQTLLEDQRQFQIIDREVDFNKYELIVFPDKVRFDEELTQKVTDYLSHGGKILLTGESGLKANDESFAIDLGVDYDGDSEYSDTYLRIGDKIDKDLYKTDYVMYERGKKITASNCQVLAKVVHPYFDRAWNHFMSHQHAAPDKESQYAAVVKKDNIIYIAYPIFRAYKKHGNLVFKKIVSNCLDLLLGKRMVSSNLPSTAQVSIMDQKEEGRRVVHILHYPIIKRCEIEIIEDVIPLYNIDMSVDVPFEVKKVYLAPDIEELEFKDENGFISFNIPKINGHAMIVLEK
ncbi:MAG TPA: alpha-amylase family protein [Ruminiclostridium sp.]